ncbi:ferredoxin [Streptococcus massiliensis]|uniref:ferredoxin n=1 Tax=Streptococcus massiliensis TaxID=313439 RepID=UPI0009D9E76B|nr:ferredoxin [Streptococcus massiliensis]
MKVKLLPERCIACGLCQTYSEIFDYHDNGIVKFSNNDELEQEYPSSPELLEAIRNCPTRALLATNPYNKSQNNPN